MRCLAPLFILTAAGVVYGADPQLLDVSKGRIERPTERLVRQFSQDLPRASQEPVQEQPETEQARTDNPAVQPGKVRWHADFEAACQASRQSGKPVLLFQLLGQLDQRFT